MRLLVRLVAALFALMLLPPPALAHEVRPALFQIVQTGPGDYDVTWKQPTVGDMAVHLVPHLSSGAIDGEPAMADAEPGFLIKVWHVKGGAPLEGQTASVEGLPLSVTDVLLRITTASGKQIDSVMRPAAPSQVLRLAARVALVPWSDLGAQPRLESIAASRELALGSVRELS